MQTHCEIRVGHPWWRAFLNREADAVWRLQAVQNICSLEMFESPNVLLWLGLVVYLQEAAGK